MKRNANAAAHAPAQGKLKQTVKQALKKAVKATPKNLGVDTNALSAADLDIINKMDERLQNLYYLNDEENYLGI